MPCAIVAPTYQNATDYDVPAIQDALSPAPAPNLPEMTGPQSVISPLIPCLAPKLEALGQGVCLFAPPANEPGTYSTCHRMLLDPSIGLARFVAIAPILTPGWSCQADDDVSDDMVAFIQEQFEDRYAATRHRPPTSATTTVAPTSLITCWPSLCQS